MALQNYLVITNNMVIDSHVWDISANPTLPDIYDPSTHMYIQCDIAGIGYTHVNGIFTPPVSTPPTITIPLLVDPMIAAHATITEQANTITAMQQDILTLHSSISAIICSLNAKKA